MLAEHAIIVEIVDRAGAARPLTLDQHLHRIGTHREHQLVVGDRAASGQQHLPLDIERLHAPPCAQVEPELCGHLRGGRRHQRVGVLALGECGRQRRLRVEMPVVGGDERQGRVRRQLAQLAEHAVACEARADDDDVGLSRCHEAQKKIAKLDMESVA
jgi:hypothetical protein